MLPPMAYPAPNTFTVPVAPRDRFPNRQVPIWAPQFSPMPPMR
jgi:hypothetical protein